MSIKTLEELFEEVKKLYPEQRSKYAKGFNMIQIFTNGLNYRIFEKKSIIDLSKYYYITIGVSQRKFTPITKSLDKIYNIIKALKECEDE